MSTAAELCVESLDREWPSPPTASLHAWPFQTVMLSHVIRRPAGNHLLKAALWCSPSLHKEWEKGKHAVGWSGTVLVMTGLHPACISLTHRDLWAFSTSTCLAPLNSHWYVTLLDSGESCSIIVMRYKTTNDNKVCTCFAVKTPLDVVHSWDKH